MHYAITHPIISHPCHPNSSRGRAWPPSRKRRRRPFLVAKAGATLDLLSEGRFTLAVAVGYLKREFAALGVDFDERTELFDEALDVIRSIWTADDVSFEGRHFTARGITAHPRPVSRSCTRNFYQEFRMRGATRKSVSRGFPVR